MSRLVVGMHGYGYLDRLLLIILFDFPFYCRRVWYPVEATSYGDILALADAPYTLGPEIPDEFGLDSIENCLQVWFVCVCVCVCVCASSGARLCLLLRLN